jgi:hypothetical protein
MLVKIKLVGSKEYFQQITDKLGYEDQLWLEMKYMQSRERETFFLEMDLAEVVRLLTAFNDIEKVSFEVR